MVSKRMSGIKYSAKVCSLKYPTERLTPAMPQSGQNSHISLYEPNSSLKPKQLIYSVKSGLSQS